ncbi:MAG TPA: PEGA domain-containing protein [Planctomycetota bacterium]|nr:PEGA domain-containing protein [Planctomycetota bacterium]
MRRLLAALLAMGLVPACSTTEARLRETPQVVALVVRTNPAGAQVRVNRIDRAWTTPCDVADPSLRRGPLDVTVSLPGYESVTRRLAWDGEVPARLELGLIVQTGTIVVQNAPPGASVTLLRAPAGLRDVAAFLRLYSDGEESQRSALEALPDEDALLLRARIQELAGSPVPAVAEAAKKKSLAGAGAGAAIVVQRVTVDAGGAARLAYVPIAGGLHLLVSRTGLPDFVKGDVRVDPRSPLAVVLPAPPRPPEPARPPQEGGAAAPLARLTVKAAGDRVRVTAGGKVVADVPTVPEESVKLTVPREKVLVEFLDSKTGQVTGSVELTPEAEAAPAPVPDPERIGRIQLVHRSYGVFVRLEAGQDLGIGDLIAVYRDGQEVARAKVLRVCAGDSTYPAGAAMLSREAAGVRKGDEARRVKP